MNIEKIVKDHHQAMVDKGFYPEGEDKNIGELLMLIVSKLSEALEAHRCGRVARWDRHETVMAYKNDSAVFSGFFERDIKDSFEDEIADVFLRLFDLLGYFTDQMNLPIPTDEEIQKNHTIKWHSGNIGAMLYRVNQILCKILNFEGEEIRSYFITHAIAHLFDLCDKLDIPIEKHIDAKMAYNKTRPHKHGKSY